MDDVVQKKPRNALKSGSNRRTLGESWLERERGKARGERAYWDRVGLE
jgi:hypothetical protein